MEYEQILQNGAVKDFLRVYSFAETSLQFGVFPENQCQVSDPIGIARRILLRSFTGQPFTVVREELLGQGYPEAVIRQTFERLRDLKLLQERTSGGDRYQRQRRFFEIFKDNFLSGEVYQASLREAGVLILGLGPLGSKLAHLLTVAGVGRVVAVDGAVVRAEDLLHQHFFAAATVGRERWEVWNRRAGVLNSEVESRGVRCLEDLSPADLSRFSLCLPCDPEQFPVDATERLCAAAGLPYMLFGIAAGRAVVDPLYVPGRTPCPACLESPLLRAADRGSAGFQAGLLRSALANVVSLQTIKLLSGFSAPNNLHRRLRLDFDRFEVAVEEPRVGRCASCLALAERAATGTGADVEPDPATGERLLAGAATPGSRVELHPLVENRDGDQFILGREATGTFLSLGEPERLFLRLLEQGMTIGRACRRFAAFFGVPDLKVAAFFADLAESGFLKKVDGRPLQAEPREKRFLLTRIQPRHVAFLFSYPALALYALVLVTALALTVRHPDYLPRYRDVYFLPSVSLSLIINALMGWLIVVPHELFHLFAARSVGCESGITLGNRLMFVVAQTDVTNLWKVPRRKRNIVYLAGMISDLMIGSSVIFILWLTDAGLLSPHPYFHAFVKSVLFLIAFKLTWNFLFYMRTDIYYLIANLLHCQNLHRDTVAFLRNELAREVRWIRPVEADPVPDRERRFVYLYAVFFLLGTLLTVAAFSAALLPLGLLIRNAITSGFTAGIAAGRSLSLVDSAVASGLILLQLILLAYAVTSNRKRKELIPR